MASGSIERGTTKHKISYISCGPAKSKITLICIHGWACQGTNYSYMFTELLKQDLKFRAVALDLPGHGKSSTEYYPVAGNPAFAEAVLTLCEDLELSDVVIVGHSMGTRVVLEAWQRARAAGRPNVKGLVFVDGSTYKFRKTLFAFDTADPRSNSLSAEAKRQGMVDTFKGMFSHRTPVSFQESTLKHVRNIDAEYNESMRKSHISFDFDKMDDVLTLVREAGTPLLNLQSTNVDEFNARIPLKRGERTRYIDWLQQMVPHAVQIIVEDSNHFPQVDQAVVVAERVREYVEGLGGLDGFRSLI